jgi:hypothetical protein
VVNQIQPSDSREVLNGRGELVIERRKKRERIRRAAFEHQVACSPDPSCRSAPRIYVSCQQASNIKIVGLETNPLFPG